MLSSHKLTQPNLILHINSEGDCFEVAPGDGATTSRMVQDCVASNVHDQLPIDAESLLMPQVRKAIATGTAELCELNLQVNGKSCLFQVQVVPYTAHDALTAIHDISEHIRTGKELRRSQEQLRKLAQHLQTAREEERARIAREIHDQMGQELTALKIDLARLRAHLNGDRARVDEHLADMTTNVEAIIRSVQDIAAELRPRMLDDFGLPAAIEWQVEKFSKRTGITCTCTVPGQQAQIDNHAATALFRIVQEALTNVARHAHADNVSVSLEKHRHWTILEILDDGRGVHAPDTDHRFALGVIGMQERARALGGEATVTARTSGGTRVSVRVPTQPSERCRREERRGDTDRRRRQATDRS